MSQGPRTAAQAHVRMDVHEAECALRYEALNTGLGELKDAHRETTESLKAGNRMLIALMVTVILSLIGIVWTLNNASIERAQEAAEASRQLDQGQ